MKKRGIIIGVILLMAGLFCDLNAQELPMWLRFRIRRSLKYPLAGYSDQMPFDPTAPLCQEEQFERNKYLARMEREDRANKALEPVKNHFRKPSVKTSFKLHGGNTEGNWSSFPDRALDARVIRYPMPRSAAYGKGPARGAPRGRR